MREKNRRNLLEYSEKIEKNKEKWNNRNKKQNKKKE